MEFTLEGSDARFYALKRRLEADGHAVVPDGRYIIAAPALRRGVPYYTDPVYVVENAALTAEAATELVMRRSPRPVTGMRVLVVGYGRIGSLLAGRLAALGAEVTVAARRAVSRAEARARGYRTVDLTQLVGPFDTVVNTVPARVLTGDLGGALCIDLASAPGGWAEDEHVVKAPGLPGLYAPLAAADIMAEAIYRVTRGEGYG